MKGFIIYPTYETIENQTYVQLFGKTENGQSFVTINKFFPYFYIKEKDKKYLPKDLAFQKTKLTNFKSEPVLKISFESKTKLDNLFKELHKKIEIYEADLKPHYRFIIDNSLLGTIDIEGDHEPSEKVDRVYKEAKITSSEFSPKLKILSIDIESDKKGNLYCIGLSGENYKKCFMITDKEINNTTPCKDEADCLEKFKQELFKQDPDIIIGWNVIDFDFAFLRELFNKHEISFDLGRNNEEVKLRIESGFFRSSSINIPGRLVLDGLNLIKDPLIKEAPSIKHAEFNSLTLEDVSQALLKKGKLLKGQQRHEEIEELYKKNSTSSLQKLVDYNLMDCELVYEMLEKTKIIDLAIERSHLTGMPLDRITASIASFDSLYIREANKRGLVSPTMNYRTKEEKIKGGYVASLKPGIYKNVLILDFKSLYPSVIKTFNIDPSSFLDKKGPNSIESPNKAYFKNKDGILPNIIERLHQAREKAKKEKRELANYAIKTIMNSFWGVLASPNCRYFNFDMANAITSFARWATQQTAKEIEKKYKMKVIYSDTDSVFVETKLDKKKAEKLGEEIGDYINNFYKKYIKKNFNRTSYLELEFEKQYLSMIIPQLRGKEGGAAKKRYAGLKLLPNNKEELEITGLEAIRGDWTEAAKDFQRQLLDKLFHDEPVEKFIRSYIKKLQDGKMNEKLVYSKSIRKKLSEYTKTTPPHVKAARKLSKLESNVIKYYVTIDGPEPVQILKSKIDYDHYIEKQIKPIAQQILTLLNKEFDDVAKMEKQGKLF
ncbi:MAG: DNA polymerase II [archaeon]